MNIVKKRTADLVPYKRNTKMHDRRQILNVAESIRQYGFVQPIVIDKNNVVVIGHCRLAAALELDMQEVPCVCVDDLTPKQVKALRIVDNKTNESPWDFDILGGELAEIDLSAFDLDFGFEDEEEETEIVEDEVPEVDETKEPTAKLGDIWQLGRHRLMCGDSTVLTDIEKLLDGKKPQLFLSDPPYGIDIVTNKKVGGGGATHFGGKIGARVEASDYIPIANDNSTDTARDNYAIVSQLTDNQIIFGGNYFTDFLPPKACWVVLDKENTGNFADVEMAWTSFDKGAKLYRWLWNGLCRKGDRATEGKSRVHPTQKPVGLIAEILKDFSKEHDIVLDCFGGSGSTLIACEQTERTCFMIEYEPYYCDVIIQRWENLTGEKAVLISE